jgi:hypothetical protein
MNLSQFFQAIFSGIKGGLATALGQPLITFFQNTGGLDLLNATDLITYTAQLDLLRSAAIANLTKLGPADIVQLNQAFSNEMQAVVAAWVAKQNAPPATGSTAAKPA